MKNVPSYEKPLNLKFQEIYSTLSELKNNRSKYISSKQVYSIYNDFLNHLNELSIVRKDEELKGMKLELPNANDSVIDDIWQLLSLCFITCGLTKFVPATYSSLSTVFKLLGHLKESKLFTQDDLKPIAARLSEIKQIIEDYQEQDNDNIDDFQKNEQIIYIRRKFNMCENLYNELNAVIEKVPPEAAEVYEALLKLRKDLINYAIGVSSNSSSSDQDLGSYVKQLKSIEQKRDSEGNFKCDESTQTILNGLLDDCNNLIKDVKVNKDRTLDELMAELSLKKDELAEFKSLYRQLISIKLNLENLLITRRWTLRETDLYNYQSDLKKIEDQRLSLLSKLDPSVQNNLKFKNVQLLLLYLLRRCYSLIYKLLESSEPVSESLQPIHNQLSTVRRCLLVIKRIDGLNNLRELYPFQFKLASIDNLRNDGKFIINNQIPEGQGTLNALLAECFDIIHELKIELEAKEEAQEDSKTDERDLTDDEDINSDDEIELKRKRYVGFNEADYDQESAYDYDDSSLNDDDEESEYEANDYY